MAEFTSALPPNAPARLLLRAALLEGRDALAAWDAWNAHAELPASMPTFAEYRLLPLVQHNLSTRRLPHAHAQRLAGLRRRMWVEQQLLLRACQPLLEAAHAEGIPMLVLKGAALGLNTYDTPSLRPYSDVDILTHAGHVTRMLELGAQHGWVSEGNFRQPRTARDLTGGHSTGLTRGPLHGIDLHWHATLLATFPGADDALWAYSQPAVLEGVPVRVLSPAHQLLQTIVHGAVADVGGTWRWIADAVWVLRKHGATLNWDAFCGLARHWSLSTLAHAALCELPAFGAAAPADVLAQLGASRTHPSERAIAIALSRPAISLTQKTRRFLALHAWHRAQCLRHGVAPISLYSHLRFWFGAGTPLELARTLWTKGRRVLRAQRATSGANARRDGATTGSV